MKQKSFCPSLMFTVMYNTSEYGIADIACFFRGCACTMRALQPVYMNVHNLVLLTA